ncbi:MAG TPA: gliding motility-associated ABC transporter ATP-binding subunit GldA [Chitinophagaceae bacterium]|jgi:ABC-2 type transport system ATP-binding protein
MSIEVKQLSKIYGEQKAIDAISFAVGKGEIVGFLGPNGAGKSTTMKILTGFLQADGGDALVCGMDVKQQPMETKKKIGYLPEANPLYYDMYVREYLDFVGGVHHIHPAATLKSTIEEVIKTVGLTPESNKKIGQLSKGYKQRVGLAAALLHNPEVLILDEPTTGLDPNQIIEIREVIRQLGKNKTVLFSSHILQEVEAVCDRVVIINKGKIVADSQLSELRRRSQQGSTVQVAFKEIPEASLLESIPGVLSVEKISTNEWVLTCTEANEVKRGLMEMALQQRLNIVSLQSGEQRLEDVFRNLTADNSKTGQPDS